MKGIQKAAFMSSAIAVMWACTLDIAAADTVVVLPPSTLTMPTSLPFSETFVNGSSTVTGNPGGAGGITTFSVSSGTYFYGQSINQALTPFMPPGNTHSFAFYTDYVFTVAPNSFDSLTASINLGTGLAVNGLQARLYDYSVGTTQNLTLPAFTPTGTVLDSWSTAVNLAPGLTADATVITPTNLAAGTYVLVIRASSVGSSGGSYGGVLNLTPVPVPAALPLLLSGLGGLGWLGRRRKMV
jgi:PEP-CTERM motif-containing protein